MKILPIDVENAIAKQIGAAVKLDFEKQTNEKFNILKKELILEFLAQPEPQEIKAGPTAENISGTLNGVTNLFAFIGFEDGDDPIAPILDILSSIRINYVGNTDTGNTFNVDIPEASEIFAATPMPPWIIGKSWAEGIERGISGLGYLLDKRHRYPISSGKSKAALQSSVKLRGGKFKNVQYISALINKYKKRFNKLK